MAAALDCQPGVACLECHMAVAISLPTERAYDGLRRDIISCAIAPGSELSEASVCDRFAVADAAARVALTRLCRDGLLRALPRRGFAVLAPALQDVEDVYELRLMLEPMAARRAAGKVSMRELETYDAICRLGYEHGDAVTRSRFVEACNGFRVTVARACGNARLAAAIGALSDDVARLAHLGIVLGAATRARRAQATPLTKALATGDGQRAERIARDEIEASRRLVAAALLMSAPFAAAADGT